MNMITIMTAILLPPVILGIRNYNKENDFMEAISVAFNTVMCTISIATVLLICFISRS